MRTSVKVFAVLFIAVSLFSCNGKQKAAAEKTVRSFFTAVSKEDKAQMNQFYPAFDSIGGYYKSSRIDIKETNVLDNGRIEVKVKNYFTNIKGTNFDQEITLFLEPSAANKEEYKIVDSKGIMDFSEVQEYQFAVKTGCIPAKNELTDLQVTEKMKQSGELLLSYGKKIFDNLKKEVVISGWSWDLQYGYANGRGKVINNSKQTFSSLKYVLSFRDDAGNEIATDDGYLSYEEVAPGQTKEFTTITGNVDGATVAYITVKFDTQEIMDYILAGNYTGNEYAAFMKSGK